MSKDKTKAQLEAELAASEAARVLAEKRLEIAKEALRGIKRNGLTDSACTAADSLKRMGNLRVRK